MPLAPAKPELTVIMAVKGRAQLADEAIRSVREQSFRNWQMRIVYAPSEDGALEKMLQAHAQDDARLLMEPERKPGLPHAMNQGIAQTDTPFVTFQESDDVSHPERFALCLQAMRAQPQADIIAPHMLPFRISSGLPMAPPGRGFFYNCFRTHCLKRIGKLRPFFIAAPDIDFAERSEDQGVQLVAIPHLLYFKRMQGEPSLHLSRRSNNSLVECLALHYSRWCRQNGQQDSVEEKTTQAELVRALRRLPASVQARLQQQMLRYAKKALRIAREQQIFAAVAPRIFVELTAALKQLGWQDARIARQLWFTRNAAFASWLVKRGRSFLRPPRGADLPQQPVAAYMAQKPWQIPLPAPRGQVRRP